MRRLAFDGVRLSAWPVCARQELVVGRLRIVIWQNGLFKV